MNSLSPVRLYRLQRSWLRRLRARSFAGLATLVVLVGIGVALLHVSVRLRVIRVGYELSAENQLRHELLETNQRLRLELATRKNPAMIERIARERLKMVPPDPRTIRVIRAGRPGQEAP